MDVGCHTIDIIDFIVGEITNYSGQAFNVAAPYNVEDSVTIIGQCKNFGAPVSMSWSFAAAEGTFEDCIIVRGTLGEMRLSTFSNDGILVKCTSSADKSILPVEGNWIAAGSKCKTPETFSYSFEKPHHAHQPLVQLIVDELRGGKESPSKGASSLRCARIIDAALEHYYGGRDDAFWERQNSWPGQHHLG